MSERLLEKETAEPAGRFVTDTLKGYVVEAKRDRQLALAHRMDRLYTKAWQKHWQMDERERSSDKTLFVDNGTPWVPYTTATTELGEVTVEVRVVKKAFSPQWASDLSVEMRVADEEGTTYDTRLAKCRLDNGKIEYVDTMPEYNSVEYQEVEAILTHIDGYIDAQT